jgi:hypothetical protein
MVWKLSAQPYLFLYDMLVYLSGRDVVIPRQGHVKVPFVISQIEINLAAVIQYVDFPYESIVQSIHPKSS